MSPAPVVVSLPIADRPTSYAFYRDGLGLDAVGEIAADGLPEPLQFALGDGVRLMLIPTEGFGWVIGGRTAAESGHSECMMMITAGSEAGVEELVQRARAVGAEVVTPPGRQPWGYAGVFADPDGHLWMVTSESLG